VRATEPNTDGALAVKTKRPGIAITVGRAGLVGDTAAGSVLRRRRAEQHVADVPRGDRLDQADRGSGIAVVQAFDQRLRFAEARKTSVEHREVGEFHADTAERHGKTGRLVLR